MLVLEGCILILIESSSNRYLSMKSDISIDTLILKENIAL